MVKSNKQYISALRYKPEVDKAVYRCVVDGHKVFLKFHLSGILIFKKMETGTVRAVFQNEIGFTFFDFEWDEQGKFQVKQIIDKLNRPSVIKTLKKDFDILLMQSLDKSTEVFYHQGRGEELYNCYNIDKGIVCYVFDNDKIVRAENLGKGEKVFISNEKEIENLSKARKVTTVNLYSDYKKDQMPDSVLIDHHRAGFTIELNKID